MALNDLLQSRVCFPYTLGKCPGRFYNNPVANTRGCSLCGFVLALDSIACIALFTQLHAAEYALDTTSMRSILDVPTQFNNR